VNAETSGVEINGLVVLVGGMVGVSVGVIVDVDITVGDDGCVSVSVPVAVIDKDESVSASLVGVYGERLDFT
jgi:hypothetical protein